MLRALIALTVLVVAALVAFFAVYARPYRIPAPAMEPTLRCAAPTPGCSGKTDDRVLAIRLRWPFKGVSRGDIVVFRAPPRADATCGSGGTFTKRVIALPGETFAERKGVVYVNGKPLQERYVKLREHVTRRLRHVPKGSYFLLGDARTQSCDSRFFGPVPRRDLVARVVATFWPPTRIVVR
jgi:signal peptidase I